MTTTTTFRYIDRSFFSTLPAGWMAQRDLAEELETSVPKFCASQFDTLLSAIRSGKPLQLTWDTHLGRGFGPKPIERNTATVIVEYLSAGHDASDRIRVIYWGFGHDVYLKDVVRWSVPEMVTEYLAEEG